MPHAKPLRGEVKSYDARYRWGKISGVAADYWFHADAHCKAAPAWIDPVLTRAAMRRDPKAGDEIVFFQTSSCTGLKAFKWMFADAYDAACLKMAAQARERSQQELFLRPASA